MTTFTRTPQEISEQKQRLIKSIDARIAELQRLLTEAKYAREGIEYVRDITPTQENRVHTLLRKYESKVTEVTAYPKPKPVEPTGTTLLELEESKPIIKAKLLPTVKKQYGAKPRLQDVCHNPDSSNYISPDFCLKIGIDDYGNEIYW